MKNNNIDSQINYEGTVKLDEINKLINSLNESRKKNFEVQGDLLNLDEINKLINSLNESRKKNFEVQRAILISFLLTISLLISEDKDDNMLFQHLNKELNAIKNRMFFFNFKPSIQKEILTLLILFIGKGKSDIITDPKIKDFVPKPEIAKKLADIYLPDINTPMVRPFIEEEVPPGHTNPVPKSSAGRRPPQAIKATRVDAEQEPLYFKSQMDAARKLRVDVGAISAFCRGKRKKTVTGKDGRNWSFCLDTEKGSDNNDKFQASGLPPPGIKKSIKKKRNSIMKKN